MLFVILLSMLMILLYTLKCDQASDLWQQVGSAPELDSDIGDMVDWGRKWFVDLNTVAFDVKIMVPVLQE